MNVTKFAIPEIIFGANSLQYLGSCAKSNGAKRVLLVSDPGLEEAGWVDEVAAVLQKDGIFWAYFREVQSNPRDFQIQEGARFYLEQEADVIVALGGGSPMDTAKGIALIASNGGEAKDYEGANRITRPLPPMIFIPTTAGSGAEISQFAIITDVERQVKMALISRTLMPNIAIIDPLFLQTKPNWLIIASAIDALTHAIEAYLSRISSPFTEMHSLRAVELIMAHLEPALATRSEEHLASLSTASTIAGMAFSNAGLGVDHAIAHSLGGMLDVMHGLVHPIMLPAVMRFNIEASPGKMARLGEIICGSSFGSKEETALAGIDRLESFFQSFAIPNRLRDIMADGSKLEQICRMAVQDACILTNPREASWEDCLGICEEVW
jgi:alcohol dehydrogenase